MPHPLRRLLAPPARVIERDAFALRLPDGREVEITRVRHPRARRLKLSVDDRGARLTLPPRVSLSAGERFVHDHRDWLLRQLDRFAQAPLPALQRWATARLPLRGADLPLHWQQARCVRLRSGEGALHFDLSARAGDATLRRALRDFYEGEARADLGRWLPKYLPTLPRPPRRVLFKPMRSQWGSLAPDGTVALDLALALARPTAFEYVLVHELCHLIRADHSRAFWREVEHRFPAWRDERDYLHAEGRRLKAALHALLGG